MRNLPDSLISLRIGHSFQHSLSYLPPSLVSLVIGDAFAGPLPLWLPSCLRFLVLTGLSFNAPLFGLPDDLVLLSLGPKYSLPLPESLPSGLRVLDMSWCFSYSYALLLLPPTCHTLCLPDNVLRLEEHGIRRNMKSRAYKALNPAAPTSVSDGFFVLGHPKDLLANVTRLCLGDDFDEEIDGRLPESLEMLAVGM